MPRQKRAGENAGTFDLSEGTKYACIAANIPFLELSGPLYFDGGLSVHPGFDGRLPDHWHEWLGSLFSDRLKRNDLVIRASAASLKPRILDEEHEKLAIDAYRYFESLALLGPNVVGSPILLKGAYVDGGLSVRYVGDLTPRIGHNDAPCTAVTEAKLLEAYAISLKLLGIQGKRGKWLRFSKGLRALRQASEELDYGERTHHWVRALEALLCTDRGKATPQFRERCPLFTGARKSTERFFGDAYEARSLVEHMNHFTRLQKPGESISRTSKRLAALSLNLEIIALEVYRRVCNSDRLLAAFQTDESTKAFWSLPIQARREAWGGEINALRIKRERQKEVDAQYNHFA